MALIPQLGTDPERASTTYALMSEPPPQVVQFAAQLLANSTRRPSRDGTAWDSHR